MKSSEYSFIAQLGIFMVMVLINLRPLMRVLFALYDRFIPHRG